MLLSGAGLAPLYIHEALWVFFLFLIGFQCANDDFKVGAAGLKSHFPDLPIFCKASFKESVVHASPDTLGR